MWRTLAVMRRRLLLQVALASSAVLALTIASPAGAAAPWSGSGTGTTTVVDNGASGAAAQFTYSVNPGNSGSWSFSTVAATDGPVDLTYTYSGFHAFFQVRVGLVAFVSHGGVTTNVSLVSDGPVNCCAPPSGGFSYTGAITLSVHAGAAFGFTMSGSNFDSDRRLLGTLTVADTPRLPGRVGYCSAVGDTDPTTGKAIAAGTFVNLLGGQPSIDPHYAGATAASFVEGKGITCDPPPIGYALSGFAGETQHVPPGFYRYYRAP
jgi:hypothetical protein